MATDAHGHELDADGRPIIQWTPAKLAELKRLYGVAKASGAEVFQFEGLDTLTSYAKYLIEYLQSNGL